MIKIILLSIFFQKNIFEVHKEAINCPKILKFLKIKNLGSLKQYMGFIQDIMKKTLVINFRKLK